MLRERLGIDYPIIQAGMGGGTAGPELVAAVSRAGALGSLGIEPVRHFAAGLRKARELSGGRPISANLLMPFTSRAHVDACIDEKVVAAVLFFGFNPEFVARLRAAGIFVLHQVGTVAEARRALADGADGLVVQGLEAGGHLLGVEPAAQALPRILSVAGGKPVLVSGGIADASDVSAAVAAGAAGVMAGSRFLLTEEAMAHPGYKPRVRGAERTLVTRLFGIAWPARHRVVPNQATERWAPNGEEPIWVSALQRASRVLQMLPMSNALIRVVMLQRVGLPFYTPASPLRWMEDRVCEVTPLYAGESARRIHKVIPAAQAVAELARGLP